MIPPRRTPISSRVLLALSMLAGSHSFADPPEIASVAPSAVRPGSITELTLRGRHLDGVTELWTSFSAEAVFIEAGSDAERARFWVRVPADVAVGIGALRVVTREGASSLWLEMIDDLPSAESGNGHETRDRARAIAPPLAVDGETPKEASDWYTFDAVAGERLSFEVFAERIGSPADLVMRLLDTKGREVAFADDDVYSGADPRFTHTFEESGVCFLELRDITWRGGSEYRYRLRIGRFPVVSVPNPLVVRGGGEREIEVTGPLPESLHDLRVTIPEGAGSVSVPIPSEARVPGGTAFTAVGVSSLAALREEEPNDGPETAREVRLFQAIDASFARAGDRDWFLLSGEKGARFEVRGVTRECGSPADLVLRLHDGEGKILAEADDSDGGEGRLEGALDDTGHRLLSVEDLVGHGGSEYVYRLEIEEPRPRLELSAGLETVVAPEGGWCAIPVRCRRVGFDGPVELSVIGLDGELELESETIAKGKDETRLRVRVPSELGAGSLRLLRIAGRAMSDRGEIRAEARLDSAWKERFPRLERSPLTLAHEIGLGIGPPRPPFFAAEPSARELSISPGGEARLELRVKRLERRFDGPIEVRVSGLDASIQAESAGVEAKKDEAVVIFRATDAAPPAEVSVKIDLRGRFDDQRLDVSIDGIRLRIVRKENATRAETTGAREGQAVLVSFPGGERAGEISVDVEEILRLEVWPQAFVFDRVRDRLRPLATGVTATGERRDVTRLLAWTSDAPEVVTVENGELRPTGRGRATVRAALGQASATIAIEVPRLDAEPVSFRHEVIAVLARAGCSSGPCHGSPSGKGGFRLSLRGFDPSFDERTLVREWSHRRTDVVDPESSLLLVKPTHVVAHGGGRRFERGSSEWEILRRWIAEGAREDPPAAPELVEVDVSPAVDLTLRRPFWTEQLLVLARFSDGSVRDVTRLSVFTSSTEDVASVDEDGLITGHRRGHAAIIIRYLDRILTRTLTFVEEVPGFVWSEPPSVHPVDRLVEARLRLLGYAPAPLADDGVFLRRLYLAVLGRLPEVDEIVSFLGDTDPEKRARWIERALESPEAAAFDALRWSDLLRVTPSRYGTEGAHKMHAWLEAEARGNVSYDELARSLLTARGSNLEEPAAGFWRAATDAEDAAESVAQVFLGIRIQCARCHNHPFERWTQDDYVGLAAVFAGVRQKPGARSGESIVYTVARGEVRHPRTHAIVPPSVPSAGALPIPAQAGRADPRVALADWLSAPENPFFARVEANRIWAALTGRGIFDPPDDLRDSNPPSNPELLDFLAEELVRSGFDRRHVARLILTSRTWQRSSRPGPFPEAKPIYFSRAEPRLLPAEVLLDTIDQVTGLPAKFPGAPRGVGAVEMPLPRDDTGFLRVFGQPPRQTVCQCERPSESNLSQALRLVNGPLIQEKVTAAANRIHRGIARGAGDEEILRELWLAGYARAPSDEELEHVEAFIAESDDRTRALEDILWALLAAKEFLFWH